jgi:hypothetical protein
MSRVLTRNLPQEACRIFVEKVMMVRNDAPAEGAQRITTTLVASPHSYARKRQDMTSLPFSLRQYNQTRKGTHAVLIWDDFNCQGPDDINLKIAEAIFQQNYDNSFGFTLVFVTQKHTIADKLCSMKQGQKIDRTPARSHKPGSMGD